jgi:hypothetical protein
LVSSSSVLALTHKVRERGEEKPLMDDHPSDLDAVLSELSEIYSRLHDLPAQARAERADLHDARHRLRSLAARLRPTPTREALERELADLTRQRSEILDRHLSVAHVGDDRSGGMDPWVVSEFNRKVDESWRLAPVEDRIKEIKEQLAQLDGEQADPSRG